MTGRSDQPDPRRLRARRRPSSTPPSAYGPFVNEALVGEALAPFRDRVVIATKFGFAIGEAAGVTAARKHPRRRRGLAQTPEHRRIDLFYQHRVDPDVPIEDVAGHGRRAHRRGQGQHFGRRSGRANDPPGHAVHPVAALQSEYSLWWREPEAEIFPPLEKLGIGFVPFSPLAGLPDRQDRRPRDFRRDDFRSKVPRFTPEARKANRALVDRLARSRRGKARRRRRSRSPGSRAKPWIARSPARPAPSPGRKSRLRYRLARRRPRPDPGRALRHPHHRRPPFRERAGDGRSLR